MPAAGTFRNRGFTLVELLTVMAVMGILMVLTVPAVGPLIQSYNLNRAASLVTDEFTFARQSALTKNTDVEVRFYQIGLTVYTPGTPFQAFRAYLPAQALALDKISYLPGQAIISSQANPHPDNPSTTFSPLLEYNTFSTVLSTGTEVLPGGGTTQTAYVSFRFRATGGTNLVPVTSPWYLTLYSANAPINASTSLPGNYVTIQVDPASGSARTYRP